jgi:hypothetical protein
MSIQCLQAPALAERHRGSSGGLTGEISMIPWFWIFYLAALVIVILHFTGWLRSHNMEWLVLVLAVAIFPAVIFL